jgi:hypothetical protein
MIFRRRRQQDDAEPEEVGVGTGPDPAAPEGSDETAAATQPGHPEEPDLAALDELDWRSEGPYDSSEVDLEGEEPAEQPRIDLGSMIITGFPGAELRLQVSEESQQIVSAMLIGGESAIELGAFAAPRSGGYWAELRDELADAATEAGGSVAFTEGPFGVELDRLLPVTTPEGEQGYQPSRMWVVEGPRWVLRGIVYGAAALPDADRASMARLITAFRQVVVRRGEQAMAPGDLLPLTLPQELEQRAAEEPQEAR